MRRQPVELQTASPRNRTRCEFQFRSVHMDAAVPTGPQYMQIGVCRGEKNVPDKFSHFYNNAPAGISILGCTTPSVL